MQKWEYRTITRSRGWQARAKKTSWQEANAWNRDIDGEVLRLGIDGWELVTVVARSGYLGGSIFEGPATNLALDFAGFTTEEMWVFKRPIE